MYPYNFPIPFSSLRWNTCMCGSCRNAISLLIAWRSNLLAFLDSVWNDGISRIPIRARYSWWLLRNISEDLYDIPDICKMVRIYSIWRSVYFLILVSDETILSMRSIINGICFSGISQNFIQVDNVRQLSDIS